MDKGSVAEVTYLVLNFGRSPDKVMACIYPPITILFIKFGEIG